MASNDARIFHISRPPLSETYKFTPKGPTAATSPRYRLDVKPRTNADRPFMVLANHSDKGICGLVRRPMNSDDFEICLGGWGNASGEKGHPAGDDDGWTVMACPSESAALWSLPLDTGETRTFAWTRASLSLAGRDMRLVDVTGMSDVTVPNLKQLPSLAVFRRKGGLSSFGELEVDSTAAGFGEDFSRMLLMTLMCLKDQMSKRGTNALGWGSYGFEDK